MTSLVSDGVRGGDLQEGDCDRAIEEMEQAGVRVASSEALMKLIEVSNDRVAEGVA